MDSSNYCQIYRTLILTPHCHRGRGQGTINAKTKTISVAITTKVSNCNPIQAFFNA